MPVKLGPFEIRRFDTAPVTAAERLTPRGPKGASGSENFQGFLIEAEYNPDLRGAEALKTFDKMLRSDGSVQEALGHITAPLLNASWQIEPASPEPLDLEIAEAVRRAYFDWLDPMWSFRAHLDEALEFLPLGFYLFELVEKVVEEEIEYPDPETGEPVRLPRRQYLTFDRFAPRLPQTIYKWVEREGKLAEVVQQAFKDGDWGEFTMDAEDLLLFTYRRRGNDYTGRSLLRSAYKPWVFKELVEKVGVMAVERHGLGTWLAYLGSAHKNDSKMVGRLEEILEGFRSGAQTYAVLTGPKQLGTMQDAGDSLLLELVSPEGTVPDFTTQLEYHRGEIKGAILVRFSELGHGRTGARATSDTQSEVWYDALHAVARQIAEVHSKAIKRFVDQNYGHSRYPTLVAGDIESRNLQEFAEAHARLVTSGAIAADAPYRAFVRESVGAPEEDDPEAADAEREQAKTQPDEDEIEEED